MTTLTATALARNFSAYLNQVCYQGASFEIQRGTEIVARLSPPAPIGGYPLDKLASLFSDLPALSDKDAANFLDDVKQAEGQLLGRDDTWGS
ncbi:MAG: hypothetical protein HQL31_13905 [Planctomycetes bacterium]|nr:hypothetical protein [Planctomycetota bacterium]